MMDPAAELAKVFALDDNEKPFIAHYVDLCQRDPLWVEASVGTTAPVEDSRLPVYHCAVYDELLLLVLVTSHEHYYINTHDFRVEEKVRRLCVWPGHHLGCPLASKGQGG